MAKQKGFTLIELLVVVSIIGLLMSMLLPVFKKVRDSATTSACQSNLHTWAIAFSLYTGDNEGRFFNGGVNNKFMEYGDGLWWMIPLKPYYENRELLVCPAAKAGYGSWFRDTQFAGNAHLGEARGAWHTAHKDTELFPGGVIGSYGPNGWICDTSANPAPHNDTLYGRSGHSKKAWKTTEVRRPDKIPVFSDCMYFDVWPNHTDVPRDPEFPYGDRPGLNEMNRACVNRHNGFVNCLFMDWSVRKVGLKELWTLKWHRKFDTCNPFTKCGGVRPDDWPKWMRKFKDY